MRARRESPGTRPELGLDHSSHQETLTYPFSFRRRSRVSGLCLEGRTHSECLSGSQDAAWVTRLAGGQGAGFPLLQSALCPRGWDR